MTRNYSSSNDELDQLRKELAEKNLADDQDEKHVKFDSQAKPQSNTTEKKGRLIDSLLSNGDDDDDLLEIEDERRNQITINGVPLGTWLYGLFLLSAFGAVATAAYYHNEDDFVTWVIKTFFPFMKSSVSKK